ncbi:MAG: hypothetical protein IPJ34_39510 [Myxococcales bacterium]|nr:hypothetical protein [Myxococcales bacterium]
MRKLLPALGALVGLTAFAPDASAFSTRLHIALSNDVRQALIAHGTGIPLKLGSYVVTLTEQDKKALTEQVLAFRAGAIGPDNMAFPGMTDPSHALEQDPFTQCQLLYAEAITDEERAYAIGCFLHGSTDAIAHHWVNFLTGETFTLTPITSARKSSWTNVVRHIIAESMIQDAAFAKQPTAFSAGALAHAIPKGFVLRAYLDTASPLWQRMAKHAKTKFDAARAAKPTATLATVIGSAGLATADHLVLSPLYLAEIEASRKQLKVDVQNTVKALQDPTTVDGAKLKVTAGPDGKLGTYDDKTACSASCAALYAKYFTYVGLLAPRKDASGAALPSAFDKISDKLRDDLRLFLPSYMQTVENLSAKLNTPLSAGKDGFDISKADIATAFAPMTGWADGITTIDYETVTKAVVPDWLLEIQDLLNTVGVSVRVPDVIAALLQPVVQPVKDAVKTYVIDEAQTYVNTLVVEYRALLPATKAEYTKRLADAAGPGLKGTMLDNLYTSGLYQHSFNIAAAAIAKHEVVLPLGEVGPATFDASYTPSWMQAGVCEYLRAAIFPLGLDVRALLTVKDGSNPAIIGNVVGDAPVECHDGSLSAFTGTPGVANCTLVGLESLLTSKVGSPSRAYPPTYAAAKATCLNVAVPGLPSPPAPADAGPVDDAGVPVDDAGGDGGPLGATGDEASGCGCRTTAPDHGPSRGGLAGLLVLGVVLSARRRRVASALAACASLGLVACSGDGATSSDDTGTTDAGDDASDTAFVDSDTPETTTDAVADAPSDAPTPAAKLLAALGNSVWNGKQTRAGKERAIELRFRADSLEWAEIKNPFGPARFRELRTFTPDADGKTLRSVVLSPAGWPPNPENGRKDEWTVTISGSAPRTMTLTRKGGATETFTEGEWPKPTSGLTAIVTVFSSTGPTSDAFCGTGSFGTINHKALWDFARGKSTEKSLGTDTVAGARLLNWTDPSGKSFAITDVDGFRTLGGTDLSDQFNFLVRYIGTIKHSGGAFSMRELNDDVEGALWAFVGPKVGSSALSDLFLEVHSKAAADSTADEPATTFAAGDVPVEILVLRCAKTLVSNQYDVQIKLGAGAFQLVGNAPSTPQFDDTLFPPAL